MGKEILEMDGKDRKRLHVIRKVLEHEVKQRKAAELLGLSDRQIRRLVCGVRSQGDSSIIHKLRGQPSNRRKDEGFQKKVLENYVKKYQGFGPTFAAEKLSKDVGVKVSGETLRIWLKRKDIPYPSRRARPHRHWRKRKSHFGEMIQLDGSHHDWLEGRGPRLVLMGYIDDATSEVFARFYDSEDNFSVLDSFTRYARRNGLPCKIYCDRHAVYKAERRSPNILEQLEGLDEGRTNFQRALKELDVELIHAYSPQAKGRIERLFRTLQDRLVKEMRLAGICTKSDANRFLEKYLPNFNKRYRVPAEQKVNLHRKLSNDIDLRQILCIKENRTVKNDFTVQFAGKFYQIKDRIRARDISVQIWLDSSLHFSCQGKELRYQEIHPPVRPAVPEGAGKNHHINRVTGLPKDSLWRAFMINPPKL